MDKLQKNTDNATLPPVLDACCGPKGKDKELINDLISRYPDKPVERDLSIEDIKDIVASEYQNALLQLERGYATRNCWNHFSYLLSRLKG